MGKTVKKNNLRSVKTKGKTFVKKNQQRKKVSLSKDHKIHKEKDTYDSYD